MRTWILFAAVVAATLARGGTLTLVKTIALPGVEGRIDHMSVDERNHRLFVCALGNGTVEVIDLQAGNRIRTIGGLEEPQGVVYVAEFNRLFVACGGDGTLRVFDGTSYAPLARIRFPDDADNLRYGDAEKRVYVGYGEGAVAMVDPVSNAIVGEIPVDAHPESFQLERSGTRVFINVPEAHAVEVGDRTTHRVIGRWSPGFAAANFPMALDEAGRRLFVACRIPARLLVYDTATGKETDRVELHGDCDDLFFDAVKGEVLASCGEGWIDVFKVEASGRCVAVGSLATERGARTSLLDGRVLYLAVPRRGGRDAEIRLYALGG